MNAPDHLALVSAGSGLRALLDTTPAGMLVHDSTSAVIDCNPAAERLLGLTRRQLMKLEPTDPRWRIVERDGTVQRVHDRPALRTLRTGQALQSETMGVDLPSGERRWLMVNTAAVPQARGEIWILTTFLDVTAQLAMEEALSRQRQRLLAALRGSRTSVWEWNVQTGEAQADERWAEIIGYRLEELQPLTITTWVDRIHPDDLATAIDRVQRHFAGELEFHDIEARMRHRDGSWRWIHERGRVDTRTPEGEPLLMTGTHEDITERKQAETAEKQHHELMRALFELSPLGMQLYDLKDKRTVAVNQALANLTGCSREELMRGDGRRRFLPHSLQQVEHWFADIHQRGSFGPAEVEYQHAGGHTMRLLCTGVRVAGPEGHDHMWLSAQDVTAQRQIEHELRAAAAEDRLTGLANRSAVMAELQRRCEAAAQGRVGGAGLAVMFLDFDRFKLVNDTMGHDAGDALLRAIAQRLRQARDEAAAAHPGSEPWVLSRLGGDEFVIVLPGVSDGATAVTHADSLLNVLALPYQIEHQEVLSTASIGVALSSPNATTDTLLRDADEAMYEAKRGGRGRWVLFDDNMRARLTRALRIETELRHAVARGQLRALYQPIVDLETGRMAGVEALLRWEHPELGNVPPAEFVPVAEESRQIVPLGEWMLREACHQWVKWQQQAPELAPAQMSVNLSRAQLILGSRLLESVRASLDAAGMPASALQLEIAEREVIQDAANARSVMQVLAGMGVTLAMDNFGTGTSSLAFLRDYPFKTIKIDKSFVTNLTGDSHVLAVAHATVSVIENLDMISVAEGIADVGELATLQALGCRYGQGHFFAPPLAADRVLNSLSPPASLS